MKRKLNDWWLVAAAVLYIAAAAGGRGWLPLVAVGGVLILAAITTKLLLTR